MKLYHRDDCPFCWKVRLGLSYSGVFPELIPVEKGTKHPDVLKLSSAGTIPVFVDDDIVITQSSVLLEYINDAFAKGTLLPSLPAQRAIVRALCYYSDNAVGPALRGTVFERRDKPEAEQDKELISKSEKLWDICLDTLEADFIGPNMCGEFSMADCALLPRFALAERYGASVTRKHKKLYAYWQQARQSELFLKSC